MRIVGRDVDALATPYEQFRLDAATQLPHPKWAGANAWGPVDDSMLLLGCYLHGIGAWEALAADAGLALTDKLAGAVKDGAKAGDKAFPQGASTCVCCRTHARRSASSALQSLRAQRLTRQDILGYADSIPISSVSHLARRSDCTC